MLLRRIVLAFLEYSPAVALAGTLAMPVLVALNHWWLDLEDKD